LNLGVLLAPGAGADRGQATLVALDSALSSALSSVGATAGATAGATVVRMDFPYRKAGRRAPDRAPVLVEAVRAEAAALAAVLGPSPGLVLGGRSMGGRICSMAVASGLVPDAVGLLMISYPLHPPGKPTSLRTEHFPSLSLPCLFVSGTRDAFGTRAELEEATASIPGPVTHRWIEGKDHALRGVDGRICELALEWLAAL
jgi:predicted alpha/beta-hydrolase family hydrolase